MNFLTHLPLNLGDGVYGVVCGDIWFGLVSFFS